MLRKMHLKQVNNLPLSQPFISILSRLLILANNPDTYHNHLLLGPVPFHKQQVTYKYVCVCQSVRNIPV